MRRRTSLRNLEEAGACLFQKAGLANFNDAAARLREPIQERLQTHHLLSVVWISGGSLPKRRAVRGQEVSEEG